MPYVNVGNKRFFVQTPDDELLAADILSKGEVFVDLIPIINSSSYYKYQICYGKFSELTEEEISFHKEDMMEEEFWNDQEEFWNQVVKTDFTFFKNISLDKFCEIMKFTEEEKFIFKLQYGLEKSVN